MKGVISLLDSRHSDLVGELWDRLNREFGLSGVYETPFPHILYHTAQDYDYGSLELVLRRISRTTVPFTVRTSGLGILMEDPPKVFVALVRGFELFRFHQRLFFEVTPTAVRQHPSGFPENWMPGVALATGDVQQSMLPGIMWMLSHQTFDWEMTIDNLSYVDDLGSLETRPCLNLDLTGDALQ